ncbi:MAG: hypothetical protein VKP57_07555 [Candidatus Sericytochromatia bacterium]|nr:hypothetical protein [Candidatus Sericytochromatia bacterium]
MQAPAVAANPLIPSVSPWGAPVAQPAQPKPMAGDTFVPSAAPAAAPVKVGVMSFLTNFWDQFVGPLFSKAATFLMGLFGK